MKTINLEATCRMCKTVHVLEVTQQGLDKYKQGAYIQEAFPRLTVDERELLISGTCGTCFDKLFS